MVGSAARLAGVFGAFVIAWLAIRFVAVWLFGSSNVLAYVLAAIVAAGVYLAIRWRDRRAG